MKRKPVAGAMAAPRKQPRQDPVSCELCRKKKLKCDRNVPCSSCTTRKLPCSYGSYGPGPRSPAMKQGSQTEERPSFDKTPVSGPQQSTAFLNDPRSRNRDDPPRTADWLETIVMGHRVPSAIPAPLREELSQHSSVAAALPHQSSNLKTFRLLQHPEWAVSGENPSTIALSSFLPDKEETMYLLQYYCDHLDYQYHLIIPNRTKRDIDHLYESLLSGNSVNLHHMALIFAIASTAMFFKVVSLGSADLAEVCGREIAFLAGASLIQSNYVSYPSVEGLQAAMIIGHHLSSLTLSPAVTSLFLHGALISQAKSLGLHTIDSPPVVAERSMHGCDMVDIELRRRLWWDLASYDWLLGFLSGPQEWTYTIQPGHMNVRRPLNVEDENIEGDIGAPLSTPTSMSYTLHRLQLAEVCREIVDTTASEHLSGQEVPYEKTLDLDRKLHEAYFKLPAFFRFDRSSQREFEGLYRERPAIAWQRAFLHQGYHSRLCRLHRQYFVRGAKDPRYSYSHVVSLQSARRVLEVKRIMDEEEPRLEPDSSFFWAVMHHVFMAAVILLIDVCFNWDDILSVKRKEEVLDACRMLSQAQETSSVAREGINAMMGILRKYWRHDGNPGPGDPQTEAVSMSNPEVTISERRNGSTSRRFESTALLTPQTSAAGGSFQTIAGARGTPEPTLVPLEDLWSEMIDGTAVGLDTPDWTNLLTELTNTTAPCE